MEQTGTRAVLTAPDTSAVGPTEFTVNKQDLLRELSELQRLVQRKVTIPILVNILIQATGNVLALTATDLDLSLRTTCPARVKREGLCTIPAHKLHEYVRLLQDGDVTVRLLENNWVQIKSGRSHTKMVGLAPESYPKLPLFPSDTAIKLDSHVMRSLIARTMFAVSTEESRYTLNGALLVLKPGAATMVATDGHRMAFAEYPKSQATKEIRVLLPKKALSALHSLLTSSSVEQIQFAQNDSTLFFGIGSRLLTTRQIMGQFPNYETVLRVDNNHRAVLSRDELFTAIQRVAQFSDARSNSIRIRLANNEFKVSSSNAETGESEDVLQTTYTGEAKMIAFNSQYLLEFLKAVDSSNVRLEFKDGESASELRPDDSMTTDCTYRYVVMPLRV
jgi:DNA polymerase III subunit beta